MRARRPVDLGDAVERAIERRIVRVSLLAMIRTIPAGDPSPEKTNTNQYDTASPIVWKARPSSEKPGPIAKRASVFRTAASVACSIPPAEETASGSRISTPASIKMLWKRSVQTAARKPPISVYPTTRRVNATRPT